MKKILSQYKGLPKDLYYICVAQIVNRFGDFVIPFLTLYLTSKLGLSSSFAGVIVMTASIIGMPAAMIGGKTADLVRRKKVYMIFQSLAAVFLIPCAFTMNPWITIICLLTSSFCGSALRPAFMAMVTDILPTCDRQAGLSLNYLSINVGVALGPLVAGFLFNKYLPIFFIGDAITSFAAVALIALGVKEKTSAQIESDVTSDDELKENKGFFRMLISRPQLLCFMLLLIIYDFVYSQHAFSIPLILEDIFAEKSSSYYGIMMSVNAITVLALTLLITAAVRHLHQLSIMALAGITFAVGFGGISLVKGLPSLILLTMIWTSGEILESISSGVFIAANSPVNFRARIQSMTSIIWLIGASLGTFICGICIDRFGSDGIGRLLFTLSLIASALMFILKCRVKRSDIP